jgi:hypothetical protein
MKSHHHHKAHYYRNLHLLCNNPSPSCGGATCSGSNSQTQSCCQDTCGNAWANPKYAGTNLVCAYGSHTFLCDQSKDQGYLMYNFYGGPLEHWDILCTPFYDVCMVRNSPDGTFHYGTNAGNCYSCG